MVSIPGGTSRLVGTGRGGFAMRMPALERDVVLGGRGHVSGVYRRGCAAVAAILSGGEEAHGVGGYFVGCASRAILFCPDLWAAGCLIGRQPAFHKNLGAFFDILIADFCGFAPGGNTEPNGFLYLLAI